MVLTLRGTHMKTAKPIIIAAIFILIFVVAGLTAVIVLVDPNDYKQPIIEQVKKHTGRDLILDGAITLSVFPWIGLELENASLQNPNGFTDKQFIAIEKINIKVALLPLLKLQTQIGNIQLRGLSLNLEKRADGKTNWQDLISTNETDATPDEQAPDTNETLSTALSDLSIGGIEIENAGIIWRDASTNTLTKIESFNFKTSRIQLQKPIHLRASFALRNQAPKLIAGIELTANIIADPTTEQYQLEDVDAEIRASGAPIPTAEQTLQLQIGSVLANLAEQTTDIQKFRIAIANIDAVANIKAQKILSESPKFTGDLSLQSDSLRKTMTAFAFEIPEMADTTTLTSFTLDTSVNGNTNALQMSSIQLRLDDSTLTGNISVQNFDNPSVQMDISLDTLNADRYLPPETETDTAANTSTTEEDPLIELPEESLRDLDMTATVKVGQLQFMNAKLNDINSKIIAKNSILTLDPLNIQLYEGAFKGSIVVDVSKASPAYNTKLNIQGLNADPLLSDLGHKEFLEGKGNLNLALNTSGRRLSGLKRNLNGGMQFKFNDGVLKGFNVNEMIREWKAKLKQQAYTAKDTNNATPFGTLTGDSVIQKGIVNNTVFKLSSERITANGKGTIDLNTESLQYSLEANYIEDLESGDGKYLPLYIKGPFANLSYGIDWGLITDRKKAEKKQEIQQKVELKKQEKQEEVQQKIEQKKQDKKDELKQKLKDKLKLKF